MKRYVDAILISLENMSNKDMAKLISADAYLSGLAHEDSIKFALIRCFSDIIKGAPAIRLFNND